MTFVAGFDCALLLPAMCWTPAPHTRLELAVWTIRVDLVTEPQRDDQVATSIGLYRCTHRLISTPEFLPHVWLEQRVAEVSTWDQNEWRRLGWERSP